MHPGPVFSGQSLVPGFFVAGDPSILKDASGYRMFYGCYATDISGTETCLATSPDGLVWEPADTGDTNLPGRVLYASASRWDGAHETPYAVQRGADTWVYVIGYDAAAEGFLDHAFPISLGVAKSVAGGPFVMRADPVFGPGPGQLDDHGMTSPTIIPFNGGWVMTYTGWCMSLDADVCPRLTSVGRLTAWMGAISADGETWERNNVNLFPDEWLPSWAPKGIAETHVFQAPGGEWVLLFQALADGPHAVGLALAAHPLGPWTVRAEPLITVADMVSWANKGPVAPHGLIENGRLRIWFAGESGGDVVGYRIGYAEGPWPLP